MAYVKHLKTFELLEYDLLKLRLISKDVSNSMG